MPELPEVETIKRGLEKKIIGLKITNILILNPKTFQGNPENLRGKKVLKIWRRAKILGIDLDDGKSSSQFDLSHPGTTSDRIPKNRDSIASLQNDKNALTLLFHLKMSGQLIFLDGGKRFIGGHPTADMVGEMPNKSTRVIIEFGDGGDLYFNDQRKFGWIKLGHRGQGTGDSFVNGVLKNLGPEPLEKEFTWEVMKQRVSGHKSLPIKVAILDQKAIAGVGNIYASEACFNAKLDPRKKVSDLTDSDWKRLFIGLITALEDGIKYGGSTRTHFVNSDGEKGLFLDYANVYQRDGQPCKICGTQIKKITLGTRGTYFCPKCQT